MHPPSTDSPECPEGYRRYVYRIDIRLPSRIKFPFGVIEEPHPSPPHYAKKDNKDNEEKRGGPANSDEQDATLEVG